jgi:septin family protein
MDKQEIIKNIAKRSGGDIYLGVVGAVRTGKSTFIKRMVETLIVPNIYAIGTCTKNNTRCRLAPIINKIIEKNKFKLKEE